MVTTSNQLLACHRIIDGGPLRALGDCSIASREINGLQLLLGLLYEHPDLVLAILDVDFQVLQGVDQGFQILGF